MDILLYVLMVIIIVMLSMMYKKIMKNIDNTCVYLSRTIENNAPTNCCKYHTMCSHRLEKQWAEWGQTPNQQYYTAKTILTPKNKGNKK